MRLLPAGEVFLQHARRILAEVDAAVHSVRADAPNRPNR
jgi:DNA-binding transcriptional LysR family regulator